MVHDDSGGGSQPGGFSRTRLRRPASQRLDQLAEARRSSRSSAWPDSTPVRISRREYTVAEMLPEVGIEPAHLSQQLAVLRRANLVTSRKVGSSVRYSLTSPHVAELLAVARLILTGVLSGQAELLDDLRASAS